MTLSKNSEFFEEYFNDCETSEIIDVVEFGLGYVPFIIERIDDGEQLQLNKDKKTYSFVDIKDRAVRGGSCKYTWGRLFRDHRCLNSFVTVGWVKIENIDKAFKKQKKK